MRAIDHWLDRFCRKHPKLAIPNLMLYIVVGNGLVYLLDMFSSYTFSPMLAFIPRGVMGGQIWRLITFVFVPDFGSNAIFFLISLYFYWFIGTTLAREWGDAKFTVYYLLGTVFNVLTGLVLSVLMPTAPFAVISMEYVNLSLFFAFATLYPNLQFLIFFLIPVKAKWLAWLNAAFFVYGVWGALISGVPWLALVPIVAILNYVLFFWSELWGHVRRLTRRTVHQSSRKTVNFKAAARAAKETKGYMHKCAVCGKTDAEHPELEFRYCSKCDGYYCYCMEHINSHVHHQE